MLFRSEEKIISNERKEKKRKDDGFFHVVWEFRREEGVIFFPLVWEFKEKKRKEKKRKMKVTILYINDLD